MPDLSPATREALLKVGTSTLTGILSRRGFKNMFLQDVWPVRPDVPRAPVWAAQMLKLALPS